MFTVIKPISVTPANIVSTNLSDSDYQLWSGSQILTAGTRRQVDYIGKTLTITVDALGRMICTSEPTDTSVTKNWIPTSGLNIWTLSPILQSLGVYYPTPTGLSTGAYLSYTAGAVTATSFTIYDSTGTSPILSTSYGMVTKFNCGFYLKHDYELLDTTKYADYPPIAQQSWLDLGVINAYKMFDQSIGSATIGSTGLIDFTVTSATSIDSVVLLSVNAESVRVLVTEVGGATVYDKTIQCSDNTGITDWYPYFFNPIIKTSDFSFLDIPPRTGANVRIVIKNTSGLPVSIGTCVIGKQRQFGEVEYGGQVGIQDYSVKSKDTFGNITIAQRSYNKRSRWSVWMDRKLTDTFVQFLANNRATPLVYIGTEDNDLTHGSQQAMIIYGFYKDFNVEISYPTQVVCSLELEGLT